jgi:xylulokinase
MTKKQYVLAIDVGTGGAKTVLFDSNLAMVAQAFEGYETHYPKSGWAEQNPEDWWVAIAKTVGRVIAQANIAPTEIAVLGIDAMTPVLVPIDGDGRIVRPAIIWIDRRASEQCRFIDRELRDELFRITGNHNDPSNFGPKLMWYRSEEPDAYKRTAMVHHAEPTMRHSQG